MKILNIKTLEDLKKNSTQIKNSIATDGSVILRGLFDPKEIRSCLPLIYKAIDEENIDGTSLGTKEKVRKNYIKWSIGAFSGAQIGNARLMLTIYNSLANQDIYNFHKHFKKLIDARDAIRDDGINTHDHNLKNGAFNSCRFQIYPQGGGFMSGHTDYVAEETSQLNGSALLQMLLFVTEKGKDFKEGGAFIKNGQEFIDTETSAKSGDIAIYNGASFHGVKDIDPFMPFKTNIIRGRVVALVTTYK